ncbi:prostaglandin reductase 1-like isoform X1 [Bacillus rossius redtenbacheri]|uniref:prostaglandin reductase 1-like isoform X1 n=1 Tax=Bacillus rossius redtenbacheri TaxID=93214 RepID=UPI002FDD72DC
MVKARRFVLAKHFVGEPKEDDFELVEEELPDLKDGEIRVEAVALSVDPYMRPYSVNHPVGTTMFGSQVARIVESRSEAYPVGKLVVGQFGWRERAVVDVGKQDLTGLPKPYIVPDFKGLSKSLALGVLGMTGNTAYFGFLELCKPKAGETVAVTGAAGAVGSTVGQIAKIKGCKVIGFAGSDDKVKWLTSELGFDHAFNYKTTDIDEALKKAAPNGIDCYFDNVGGKLSSTIIKQMNNFGRISVCGSVASYNEDPSNLPEAPIIQRAIVGKQLKMEGFLVKRWSNRWLEGINQLLQWIVEGKLKYNETVTRGFENMPTAFIEMLQGKNVGKAVVKV